MTSLAARFAERASAKKRDKEKPLPEWLTDMLVPSSEDPEAFVNPVCVMLTKLDPLASLSTARVNPYIGLRPGHITRNAYYKLAYDTPLEAALKHKQFVEFPTIEVWEEGAFSGTIVDDRGSIVRKFDDSDDEDGRKPKRRKLGQKEGKKTLGGLLGGYGSESDDGSDEKEEEKNVLNMLSGYAGSDDDGDDDDEAEAARRRAAFDSQFDYELGDEDAEGETDDGDEFEDEEGWGDEALAEGQEAQTPEVLAALLQHLKETGALRDPAADSHFSALTAADEDQVDWGDSADEGEP